MMWRPEEVVPEHKRRARIVWIGLLASITAYILWEVVTIVEERKHPSTRLEVSDDAYEYPLVLVCVFDGQGCEMADGTTDYCIKTALEYSEVKVTYATGDTISTSGTVLESQWSNCVLFDLTAIEPENKSGESTEVVIDMFWVSSTDASSETVFLESVGVYIADSEPDKSTLNFINVPYGRNLYTTDDQVSTDVELTIGKTTRKLLGGTKIDTFPVLTISTTSFKHPSDVSYDDANADLAFGTLYMTVNQGSYSRSVVTDVNPLDMASLLGNIGGFWELMIIVWGLCFISIKKDRDPDLKARDFIKSLKVGKEVVTRRRSFSESGTTATQAVETTPPWDADYRGRYSANATSAVTTSVATDLSLNGSTAIGAQQQHIQQLSKPTYSGTTRPMGSQQRSLTSSSKSRRPVECNEPRRAHGPSSLSHSASGRGEPVRPTYQEFMNRVRPTG